MTPGRIALVEDEPDIAEVLQYNLEKEGFQVEIAGRGDTAWTPCGARAPDLSCST